MQIAGVGTQLYQLHNTGAIWRYTGTPCSGTSWPGWQRLDNNAQTANSASIASIAIATLLHRIASGRLV